MKKLFLVIFITVFACLAMLTSCGETEIYISNENRELIGFTGQYHEELIIPKTFQGKDGTKYKVVGIDARAFADCENLKTVTLPNSVKEIGESAFSNCVNLISISIPERATLPNLHPQNNYCTL